MSEAGEKDSDTWEMSLDEEKEKASVPWEMLLDEERDFWSKGTWSGNDCRNNIEELLSEDWGNRGAWSNKDWKGMLLVRYVALGAVWPKTPDVAR